MRFSIIALACLLASAAPAHAADFLFSFGSTPGAQGVGSAAFAGTVTGRILGLPDNGTGAATQVWIDSYSPNPIFAPILATGWNEPGLNSFAVGGGQIVSGTFKSGNNDNFFGQFYDRLFLNFDNNGDITNYASIGSNSRAAVWNTQGLPGVTFARINLPVPEPATWAMMLIGFGFVGTGLRRSRVRTLAAQS